MSILKRLNIPHAYYFITQVTYNRNKIFANIENVKVLNDNLNYYLDKYRAGISAYVFLPDHLHFIIRIINKFDLSKFMHDFKSYSAKMISKERGDVFNRKPIWQKRFYDHAIRNEKDFKKHLDYIHFNPVKHGLANCPEDYRYSTYELFVKKNYYKIGWGYAEPDNIKNYYIE